MYGGADALRPGEDPNVFYYLTVYNEPYQQPTAPEGLDRDAVLRGLYRYAAAPELPGNGDRPRVTLLASGTGVRWALAAQQLLADDWGVAAEVWSVTSWNELRRDAVACDEHNLLHPDEEPR